MSTGVSLQTSEFAITAARAVADCASLDPREQAKHLANGGLLGVIAAQDVGGLDLPLAFAVPVVVAAGAGLLGFPLIETLLVVRALQATLPRAAEAIASGDQLATIAWQGSVRAQPRGESVVLDGTVARVICARDADWLLVRLDTGGAALVPTDAAGVSIDDAAGLDIAVPEHAVLLNDVSIPVANLVSVHDWDRLWSDAKVLRAAAILGSAETCLALAQEHVSTRRQFGRALSFNQAIRHSLARQKLVLEGMRHAIARSVGPDAGALERDAAFLTAATQGCAIGEAALQVHGGMGFTWDVPIHRHLRRIRALRTQGDVCTEFAALGRRTVVAIAPAPNAAVSAYEQENRHD